MPTVVTTKGLVTSTPVLDPKTGKTITEEIMFNGRKVIRDVYEHIQHAAGAVISVEKKLAKVLVEGGHARPHDAALDADVVDPTKPSTDPLA